MAIVRSTDSEKIRDFRAEQCEGVSVREDGDSAKASAFEKMAIVRSTDSEKIRDFRAEQCESVSVRAERCEGGYAVII